MTVGLTEEEFENELKWARKEERERCATLIQSMDCDTGEICAKAIREQPDE